MQNVNIASNTELFAPRFVIKRDGKRVPFDAEKIVNAIKKSGLETGEFGEAEARHITFIVVKILTHKYKNEIPDIERIQDIVEESLISENYVKTARAYIVYREKRGELRKDKKNLVDVVLSINEYLDKLDWRVHANANQGYSLGRMILNI
jgi:ribonucleoside-triphosphate reductase